MPAPAWERCQGAEAALVSSGPTVPLSPGKHNFPQRSGEQSGLPTYRRFLNASPSPAMHWLDNQPTYHLSMSGGFPPQEANTYVHPEVPTGILTQPLWTPPARG